MVVLPMKVARFRPIIHTRKEIVDTTLLGVAAATISTVVVATVVNDYTGGVGDVETGSKIKWIYLFIQCLATAGTANVDFYVSKNPPATTAVPGATGGDLFRKYILHEEKGIPGNAADGAYPLTFKGVVKIPKGRQRMAEGDKILVVIRGTDIHNACVKCIYKSEM